MLDLSKFLDPTIVTCGVGELQFEIQAVVRKLTCGDQLLGAIVDGQ